jgi:hypothetical protein
MSLPGFLKVPPRSLTPTAVTHPHTKHTFPGSPDLDIHRRVHLIPSDLWEAITGERLSPANICQLCDVSIPGLDVIWQVSLQYCAMAKDRQGSRFLQQKIQDCTPRERKVIFDSLLPRLGDLVFDPSSNYVIQKLCEFTSDDQQTQLLAFFLPNVQRVVDHANGCRVLQKFIETTSPENVDQLFIALKPGLIQLCYSANGNHIVQRFIVALPDRLAEIVAVLRPCVSSLVIDNCGCRVVQKLFEHYEIGSLRPLVDEVLTCAADLTTNQYGNYVVQNILEAGPDADIAVLIDAFAGGFYAFSLHKFASNVIEKCIRRALPEQRDAIFREIIGAEGAWEAERVFRMVGDQFGNYVIQRIIEFGTEAQRTAIYDVVYENYENLMTRQYAKHVIQKLEKLRFEF